MKDKQMMKIKSEIWDNMQYFCKEYHDHQVRFVLYFDSILDECRLKEALMKSLEIFPILKCRFVPGNIRAFWQESNEIRENDLFELVQGQYSEDDLQFFLTGVIDEINECQIKLKLFRNDGKDTLCILMNHMICDGAGIKEYVNLLSSIYTDLGKNKSLIRKTYDRRGKQYNDNFTIIKKARLLVVNNKSEMNKENMKFTLCDKKPVHLIKNKNHLKRRIFIKTINEDLFVKIKKSGKESRVTINDILITAYYRALLRTRDVQCENIIIRSLIDLRRYLNDEQKHTICNLTSKIDCVINSSINESFQETLYTVSEIMNNKKKNYPGLNGLALLNLIFGSLPFRAGKFIIKKCYNKPHIGMSNIGILKEENMRFDDAVIRNAFITGPVKYLPYFQLSASSFKNKLTFTAGTGFYEDDHEKIEKFLDNIENELYSYVG